MDKKSALIAALRCSSTPGSECKGAPCPYYVEEPFPEELCLPGVPNYFPSCDCDRMALDAADMLKNLGADHE